MNNHKNNPEVSASITQITLQKDEQLIFEGSSHLTLISGQVEVMGISLQKNKPYFVSSSA